MVRALLAGTKTQTRRIVEPVPDGSDIRFDPDDGAWYVEAGCWLRCCPYGVVGDRLWVKEAIVLGTIDPHPTLGDVARSSYEADAAATKADAWPWKRDRLPEMFCPRRLSRITLEVTEVRVQRLQDISEEDAKAEGIEELPGGFWTFNGGLFQARFARDAFSALWDSINGDRCAWSSSPWVWVIAFKRVDTSTREVGAGELAGAAP